MIGRNNESGAAGLEFALIAPMLILAFLGALDIRALIQASARLTAATATVADLTAQSNAHTTSSIDSILSATRLIFSPLPADTQILSVTVASVGFDANTGTPAVYWKQVSGAAPGAVDLARCQSLGSPGESVILVSTRYQYSSFFSFFSGPLTLNEISFVRPRLIPQIPYNGKVSWP
jgi:Flp pilus assembly protein TadG